MHTLVYILFDIHIFLIRWNIINMTSSKQHSSTFLLAAYYLATYTKYVQFNATHTFLGHASFYFKFFPFKFSEIFRNKYLPFTIPSALTIPYVLDLIYFVFTLLTFVYCVVELDVIRK